MEEVNFLSNWVDVDSVPESFVYPLEMRLGDAVKKAIPVVDFNTHDRVILIQKILDISQEFGFFQMINHGVSRELLEETMRVFKKFHGMSTEDKVKECSKAPNKSIILHNTSNIDDYRNEPVQSWKDSVAFNCYPLDKYVLFWPQNPPKYREVVGAYCVAMRKLSMKILEVIREGLGVGRGSWKDQHTENPTVVAHHYPLCPNPSLTHALKKHCDPTLITILFQDINGLQFLMDGEWIAVDPIHGALVVNIGYILQVISNGKLKAGEHQVVMNTKASRQSLVYQVYPKDDVTIEPAKCLINEVNPPHYRSVKFGDFKRDYLSMGGDSEAVMQYLSSNHLS